MTTKNRPPGRPKGSSRYSGSDPHRLAEVADRLLEDPSLSTRAAIVRVLGVDDEAGLRRLQDKFKAKTREEWVADARWRKEELAQALRPPRQGRQELAWNGGLAEAVGRLSAMHQPMYDPLVSMADKFREHGLRMSRTEMAAAYSPFQDAVAALSAGNDVLGSHSVRDALGRLNGTMDAFGSLGSSLDSMRRHEEAMDKLLGPVGAAMRKVGR